MEDYGPPEPRLQRPGPEGFPGPATKASQKSHAPPPLRPTAPPGGALSQADYYGGPPVGADGRRRRRGSRDLEDSHRSAFVRWCDSELGGDMINLEHAWPEDFLTSQWPVPPRWYLVYRVLAAVVLICWVAGDMVYETRRFYSGHTWRWFIFATNWSFLLLALTTLLLAVTCVLYEHKPYWIIDPIHIRAMPHSLKVQWMLYNISSCSALVVTIGYWGYVAFVSDSLLFTSHMSRLKHTANSIYVIADLFISATPVRVQHMFLTIFVASLYIVFNGLYYVTLGNVVIDNSGHTTGNRRGYYFMNWADPVEAICTSALGMMMVIFSQFVLHLLCLLRRWLRGKCVKLPGNGMAAGQDSELQNIISRSSTYNSMTEP